MTDQTAAMPPRPIPEDHSVDHFEGKAISLFELFKANLLKTRQPLIRGKTFIDCTIEGPAVLLALDGVNFDACNMGYASAGPRSLILMPMAKYSVVGPIAVADCLFKGCSFFAVGYTGSDAFIDRLLQVLDPETPGPDAGPR